MPAPKLSVLYPESSTPQWAAISELLTNAGLPALELVPVPLDSVLDELLRRAEQKKAPDLAMVPTAAVDRCSPLPIASIHRFAPSLTVLGGSPVLQENGETIGLRTLWDLNWFVGVSRIDETILKALKVVGTFKDPRLPVNTVERIQLLIHNQTLQLPKKLGGFKFDLHFPGLLDLKVVRDPANPNRAVLTVVSLTGQIPLALLPFDLAKLPWPVKPGLEDAERGFQISLRPGDGHEANSGSLDYLTGQTQLSLSVRTTAPFLKRLGMDGIDVDISETGRWDLKAGTLFVETGTIGLASGIFAGLKLLLLSSSKNETRSNTTQLRGWEPVKVEILRMGDSPSPENTLLDIAREVLAKYSAKANRLAHLFSLAASVNRARDVFVTYACVTTTTTQLQELKGGEWVNTGEPTISAELTGTVVRRELPLADALLWYQGANATQTDIEAALRRNAPRTGCD